METEEEFDSLVPLFASSARPIESKKRPSSSTTSPTSPSSPGPSVWHRAAAKGRTVADPWASFEIERTCETEKALRYQYDARKRHWTTDEITIKMQSKVNRRKICVRSLLSFILFLVICVRSYARMFSNVRRFII